MARKKIQMDDIISKYDNALAELVSLACSFKSDIYLIDGSKSINAKSIMGIMAFTAEAGDSIEIEVEGPDQDMALGAMVKFLKKG